MPRFEKEGFGTFLFVKDCLTNPLSLWKRLLPRKSIIYCTSKESRLKEEQKCMSVFSRAKNYNLLTEQRPSLASDVFFLNCTGLLMYFFTKALDLITLWLLHSFISMQTGVVQKRTITEAVRSFQNLHEMSRAVSLLWNWVASPVTLSGFPVV